MNSQMNKPLGFPDFHENIVNRQLVRSCYNCEHFDKVSNNGAGWCEQYQVQPPAKIIIFSCGDIDGGGWMGEIPF